MKRIVLVFVIISMVCTLPSQTLDSIPHHGMGNYGPYLVSQWDGIAQLKDGCILCNHCVGINQGEIVVGNVFYKLSRHGAVILDTLFLEDPDPPFYSFVPNPNGDGNLRLGIKRDSLTRTSSLQILPFDDNLVFDSLNEVLLPLSDTLAYSFPNSGIIIGQDDLFLVYWSLNAENSRDFHFVHFGHDGTLKHENVIPADSLLLLGVNGYGIFNESPLEYYAYGRHRSSSASEVFNCYVFDSLFQPKELITINPVNQQFHYTYGFGWLESMVVEGDNFFLTSRYHKEVLNGVCVAKYDKRTHEQKGVAYFESKPMISDGGMFQYGACPIGLGKGFEGSLYLAYNTQQPMYTDKGQIAVAKLDTDLNVLWQRFCLEPEGYYHMGELMAVLEDDGVAVCGTNLGYPDVFFLVINDDYDGLEEQGIIVRPYMFYPNPVQDELHLQFSPDVIPTQIELYDLQGRLMRTQKNGLESLNMEGLPTGTYMLRVALEGGKVFSDTIIKE